ncbi:hypothetical protein B0H10DRAFT_1778092, partial [Mycena sp. CBHHK59/15]
HLLLYDWMTVFAFIDNHSDMTQQEVVAHFRSLTASTLEFTQETLPRKLKQRSELKQWAKSNPNALSMKHERVVTRPDVECALVLWVEHMAEKGEMVTGDMLIETCVCFET